MDDLHRDQLADVPTQGAYLALALFTAALLVPVALGLEAFPFSHMGLFPYSERQMRECRRAVGERVRIVACTAADAAAQGAVLTHHGDASKFVDVVRFCLGNSDTQPAQCYHEHVWPALWPAIERCDVARAESYAPVLDTLQHWLSTTRELVHARSWTPHDTLLLLRYAEDGGSARVLDLRRAPQCRAKLA